MTNNNRGIQLKKWIDNNTIKHNIRLRSSYLPSYPSGNSYIDLCLHDARIQFHNLTNQKLRTILFDSDHNALSFTISIDNISHLTYASPERRPNYYKANWNKFRKTATLGIKDLKIPHDKNLSIQEIDKYLDHLEKATQKAIDKSIPTTKTPNSSEIYLNKKIKVLQKNKNYLLNQLNTINNRNDYASIQQKSALTHLLKELKNKISAELKKSINSHRQNKITQISLRGPSNPFQQINNIFKTKNSPSQIETLTINKNNLHLIQTSGIDTTTLTQDPNTITIADLPNKLNVLGAHFELTHNQNIHLGNPQFKSIIESKTNTIKNQLLEENSNITQKTITTFSANSPAYNPSPNPLKRLHFPTRNKKHPQKNEQQKICQF